MSEKKVGKRLLTWVLVLVMTLSLLPLNVLAASDPTTDGGAQQSAMNFTKTADGPDANGNYTITMTAQATGTTTTTTEAVPMDIGLVLVVSGWKMTGQLAGLGIMLVGVALLLAVLAIYNATYQD